MFAPRRPERRAAPVLAIAAVVTVALSLTTVSARPHPRPPSSMVVRRARAVLPHAMAGPSAPRMTGAVCASARPHAHGGFLAGLVAISSHDVWAVGGTDRHAGGGVGGRPFIEHWDGRAWRIVPSPDTGGGYLSSVSAVSAHDIWAVGTVRGEPLTERWDGARWTIVPNPRGPDRPPTPGYDSRSLRGVVAIAPRDVWAVGTVHDGELPLIEHWNMISWAVVASPQIPSGRLLAVAAVSSRDVWAGGDQGGSAYSKALAEHWDGTRWRTIPTAATSHDDSLQAFAARSTRDVWAVGGYDDSEVRGGRGAVVKHWDGRRWSNVPAPTLSGPLSGVAAVSDHDVWTVEGTSMLAHWDGRRWHVVRIAGGADVSAIAALPTGGPWAVGEVRGQPLAAHWTGGRWRQVATPAVDLPLSGEAAIPPAPGVLHAIAAVSATDIWAVGQDNGTSNGQGPVHAITTHWNGACWRAVPSASSGQDIDGANAVAAVSSHDVWAAGYSEGGADVSFGEQWDGTRWRLVSGLDRGSTVAGLAAVSASDLWAVGTSSAANGPGRIAHWDGRRWRSVPGPTGAAGRFLDGVVALSRRDVWAVGAVYGNGNGALIEHWDGRRWRDVPTPHQAARRGSMFSAVAAVSPHDLWAVGQRANSAPLIEHGDGRRWVVVTSPRIANAANGLTAVAAVSAHDVWAVGDVIEHWDGKRWQLVPAPPVFDLLTGVVAVSPRDVWAVGAADNVGDVLQVILHWDGARWRHVAAS